MTGAPIRFAGTWALIPIKARGLGKTRLSSVLSPAERERLVEEMLAHVVAVAGVSVERTLVVGPPRCGIAARLERIGDAGLGLNAALDHALRAIAARADAPARLIVLPADLPCLAPADIARLAQLPPGTIGLAPDRHARGTNALSLPLPEAAGFRFHYGTDSAARHRKQTETLGFSVAAITAPGLEKDIDELADLADATPLFSPAGR